MLLQCTDLNFDITEKQTYSFAASNGGSGFINYFPQVFSRSLFKQIFIIKGGPGTGKSRFMRYIAKNAADAGCAIEYILCSSDPTSLDGIIIHPDGNLLSETQLTGLFDGTAPHCADPGLPGACESIINLSEFWDSDVLYQNRDLLERLNQTKKAEYASCYRYLKAAAEIDHDIFQLRKRAVLYDKLNAAAARLADKLIKKTERTSQSPNVTYRLNRAISMSGCVDTHSFEKSARKNYYVTGDDEASQALMISLLQKFSEMGQKIQISAAPLSKSQIDGLYLPQQSISVTAYAKSDERGFCSENVEEGHMINTNRFVDREIQAGIRQRCRFALKCRDAMMLGAETALQNVKKTHFALEDVYIASMDFRALERYRKKKCDEILTALS